MKVGTCGSPVRQGRSLTSSTASSDGPPGVYVTSGMAGPGIYTACPRPRPG